MGNASKRKQHKRLAGRLATWDKDERGGPLPERQRKQHNKPGSTQKGRAR